MEIMKRDTQRQVNLWESWIEVDKLLNDMVCSGKCPTLSSSIARAKSIKMQNNIRGLPPKCSSNQILDLIVNADSSWDVSKLGGKLLLRSHKKYHHAKPHCMYCIVHD